MPVLPWWFLAVFVLGVNFVIWGTVGAIRLIDSRARRMAGGRRAVAGDDGTLPARPARHRGPDIDLAARQVDLTVDDVAVLMPAHNEAAVLGGSLAAIMRLVPAANIHVVSDGSTDDTPDIARRAGVRVYETEHNVGKAGALREAIGHFDLIDRYPVVLLLDADTRVDPDYFVEALPLFKSPEVVAVAGCVRTARDRRLSLTGNVLVGHRQRIYSMGQRALKFGQTYLRANATHIVPGFASLYRTDVLPHMEMNPPGLVIEDFNMTFEVYQKRLGKVAFTLGAVAETQDPDTLRDYIKQTKRWAVGLWQTVRRHPPRANLFTAMLAILLLEMITSSAIFLLLPLLLAVLIIPDLAHSALHWPEFADVHAVVAAHMKLSAVLFGVLLPDYAITILVAALERRPRLLALGIFFPLLRIVDSAIGLAAIPMGWFVRSNGTWKSPARRAVDAPPERAALPVSTADRAGEHAGSAEPVQVAKAVSAEPVQVARAVSAEPVQVAKAVTVTSSVSARFLGERTHANG
jgi:poly-beta-1,6-N-acetyl-D-glucosamine synthase